VVVVLALSVGVNTTTFSVFSAVLIRPLPYSHPDRIVMIWETDLTNGVTRGIASPANYLDWKEQSRSFEQRSPWRFWYFNLTETEEPERVQGLLAGANVFDLLGASPSIGRTFVPADERPGNNKVVVLSHNLWQSRFGGDPRVIDRSVTIGVMAYSVTQRELGIRTAIGTRQADILRLVPMGGVKVVTPDVAAGLTGAFAVHHLVAELLFGVSSTDPHIFLGASSLLAAVAMGRHLRSSPQSNADRRFDRIDAGMNKL
jgi:hypothetical protein